MKIFSFYRRRIPFCLSLLFGAFFCARAHAATVQVLIQNFSFIPSTVTINAGDTVTWANADTTQHTSTSGTAGTPDGKWDSGFLNRGGTFSHTFSTAGTFPYYCIPHASFMQGSVVVQGAAASPPTVSITSPANNTTYTAASTNITIQATAAVNGSSIGSVEFFDAGTSLGTDSSAPYSVNVTLQPGTHTLTAKASAANGTSTTSDAITVTVTAPAAVPTVNITAPANNATFTGPTNVTITAVADVQGGVIDMVEFFDNGAFLDMSHTAPFTITPTLQVGNHVLTAKATARSGATAQSAPVTVTVSAPAAVPTVNITTPVNNSSFSGATTLTVTAEATIQGGTIEMVEFFDNGAFLDMAHSAPFAINPTLQIGTHVLTAKATAAGGATAVSSPVTVTITAAGTRIQDPYPPIVKADTTIELQTVLDGLVSPLGLAAPDDNSGRLFVFDQVGVIYALTNGNKMDSPLLDMRDRIVPLTPGYDERGLLGVATHPGFAQKQLVYTYSSEPTSRTADFPINDATATNNCQGVVAEWKIDAANPNRVDPASRREIFRLDKPQFNHNGGTIHFGPDGMLYLAFGDGGAADDEGPGHAPGGNAQDLTRILGKVVRIDVDGRNSANGQYGVPTDNPFVGKDGLDEIYAYGFRNPYSWSFDRLSGELYVGDVGQNDIEELDRVFRGGNYGWRIKEGSFYFDPNGTNNGFITTVPVRDVPADLVDPIADYDHSEGLAIVGGYMYHGTKIPNLIGRYIAGDFGQFSAPAGRLFYLDRNIFRELRIGQDDRKLGLFLKGFGEDPQGELYVFASSNLGPSGTGGKMFKIVAPTNNLTIQITKTATNATLTWSGGVGPFVVEEQESLGEPLWSTAGATAQRTFTTDLDDEAAFFRVKDMAGNGSLGFTVYMTAAAERPSTNNSTGLGTGTLSLEGNTLHFDIHYSGLTGPATLAHIHGLATAANAAGVMINLAPFNGGAFNTNGVLSGSVTLTSDQKAAILSGKTYVNIHTGANPGGEIRGQIAPLIFTADLDAYNERPSPVTDSNGEGMGVFMLSGNQLSFSINYHDLTGAAILAHVHGPASEDQAAGVMVNLAPFNGGAFGTNGTLAGTVTLTPDQLAAFVDGLTYVNIHTPLHGGGEIRGQILPHSSATALSASLSGAAERPSPVTDSQGGGTGLFALEGRTLLFNVNYTNLTGAATLAHIHGPAKASEAAGVMINLAPFNGGAFGTNGTLAGSVTLTDEQRAALLEGRTYVNVHTVLHGGGEIRGQIVPSVMHTVLSGAAERPSAILGSAKASGTVMLVGNKLMINSTYGGLTGPAVAAHIHGPASTADATGVMVNFLGINGEGFSTNGSFAGTVTLTPEQIAALNDQLTYMNIHTGAHGGGEIRGQIVR